MPKGTRGANDRRLVDRSSRWLRYNKNQGIGTDVNVSFDHLPNYVEEEIQRFADDLHISTDEALVRLVQSGLANHQRTTLASATSDGDPPTPLSESRTRSNRVRRGARAPKSTANPEAIIGLFEGDETFRRSIEAVIARRSERYGSSE